MDGAQVAAGALTGFVVGMTGVGGGALMTPMLLLFFNTPPLVAVGTDLWFAATTKLAVAGLHQRRGLIDWPIVRRLWMGSLPGAAVTLAWIYAFPLDDSGVRLVRTAIGAAVCITAAGLLLDRPLRAWRGRLASPPADGAADAAVPRPLATVAAGACLGLMVTLTSVGAGALGVVALAALYTRRLSPLRLVATDIAHAIPLALVAGLGHLGISQIDLALLRDLLTGSIPAALAGAAIASRVPQPALRLLLGVVLLVAGISLF